VGRVTKSTRTVDAVVVGSGNEDAGSLSHEMPSVKLQINVRLRRA
jgi:hypothetical protein